METMPFTRQRQLFDRLSKVTSYASLNPEEKRRYDADLKAYRDLTNQIETAKEESKAEGIIEGKVIGRAEGLIEGRAEGRAEGKAEGLIEGEAKKTIEIARNLKRLGFSEEQIASGTGLSIDEIRTL